LSAAVVVGGDKPPAQPSERDDALACLLRCLERDDGWRRWLDEHGLDPRRLRECLERCSRPDREEFDRLGSRIACTSRAGAEHRRQNSEQAVRRQ
jgi:hypothetical protein